MPGKFHGQRRLAGYSPWGCKELDPTELAKNTHTPYFRIIKLNGPITPTVCEDIGEQETCIYCQGECKRVQVLWKTLVVCLKVKHTSAIWSNQSIPRYLPKTNESICPYKDLYMNIHRSFIYVIAENKPNAHQQWNE